MAVKLFFIAMPRSDGSVVLHLMKEWLRQHPETVPAGLDATLSTSHQLRRGLRAAGWTSQESETQVRLVRPSGEHLIEDILGSSSSTEPDGEEAELVDQSFALEPAISSAGPRD